MLAQGENIIAIPGTKGIRYLEENIAAVNVKSSQEELRAIDAIMPSGIVPATRYTEGFMETLGG